MTNIDLEKTFTLTRYRAILALWFFDLVNALSLHKIAAAIQVPISTVYNVYKHAVQASHLKRDTMRNGAHSSNISRINNAQNNLYISIPESSTIPNTTEMPRAGPSNTLSNLPSTMPRTVPSNLSSNLSSNLPSTMSSTVLSTALSIVPNNPLSNPPSTALSPLHISNFVEPEED